MVKATMRTRIVTKVFFVMVSPSIRVDNLGLAVVKGVAAACIGNPCVETTAIILNFQLPSSAHRLRAVLASPDRSLVLSCDALATQTDGMDRPVTRLRCACGP